MGLLVKDLRGLGENRWGRRVAPMQLESAQVRRQGRFADLLGSERKVCTTGAVAQARNLAALGCCAGRRVR